MTSCLTFTSFFVNAFDSGFPVIAGLEMDLRAPLAFVPDFGLAGCRRGADFAAAAGFFLGGIGLGFLPAESDRGFDVTHLELMLSMRYKRCLCCPVRHPRCVCCPVSSVVSAVRAKRAPVAL